MIGTIEDTRDRLHNWGRWARDPRFVRSHCYSIESRYLPERLHDDEEADRRRVRIPVDVLDAEHVEHAVNWWYGFDRRLSMVLVGFYVLKLREGGGLRRFLRTKNIVIHDRDLPELLYAATAAARARLRARRNLIA